MLLLQGSAWPLALAAAAEPVQAQKPSTFVVPTEVSAKEPFTFSVGGVVEGEVVSGNVLEGEVVSVQTVEGEVVQKAKTDKYGRVYLPAGLAAGTYLLSRSRGSKGSTQITIKPPKAPTDPSPLKLEDPSKICNAQKGLDLKGQGFSGNAENMTVTIGDKPIPVLAATASEIKTGPLPANLCGHGVVKVRNTKTGESEEIADVTVFLLKGKLGRKQLTGGEQTTLEFTFVPSDEPATINVRIISGPVSFDGGKKEIDVVIKNGKAIVPLVADPAGLGKFQVAYDLVKVGE